MMPRPLVAALIAVAFSAPAWAAEEPSHASGYEPKDRRDPFVALVREGRFIGGADAGGADYSALSLAGIVWDPAGRSIALINDTEVKVGDSLGEYEVQEIRSDSVVLVREGKPLVLQMLFDNQRLPQEGTQATGGTRQ